MYLTSFLSSLLCVVLALGCTGATVRTEIGQTAIETKARIAILPFENLSGSAVPLNTIRGALIERFEKQGIMVLGDEALNLFMARNRMRYTGGVTPDIAQAFKKEVGVDAVLITSIELYDESVPPKLSIFSQLVSTGGNPEILWMDSAGLAGDDNPGLLAIGMIDDPVVLRNKALGMLAKSLMNYFDRGKTTFEGPARSFPPNTLYRSRAIKLDNRTSTVIVAPFMNASERTNAGEIVALQFVEQLKKSERLTVIHQGLVRQELLNLRIIMDDGLSLSNVDALFSTIDADFVVTGKVFAFQDYRGVAGTPKVGFTTIVIEKKSRRVVWASDSYRQGNDGVYFFDFGQINNAHAMASNMVGTIIKMMVQ
jgi:TolB-like protein